MIKKSTPNLMVSDVRESAAFYQEHLGFELVMAVTDSQESTFGLMPEGKQVVFAILKVGGIELMLQEEASFKSDLPVAADIAIGSSISLYMEVEGLAAFYDDLKSKVTLAKDWGTTWYGANEFFIKDNQGYILGFYEAAS